MNFDLTQEQKMIVGSVATFVKDVSPVERFRRTRNTDQTWESEVWRTMGEYGWLGIAFPEDVGGLGLEFVDLALVLEQLGHGLVPEPMIPSVVFGGGLLQLLGTAEQQQELLAPMIEGRTSLAVAFTERQSRYDLADCTTRAERTADGYRIDGEKVWVLNGHAADHLIVVARLQGDQLDPSGLAMFVVPAQGRGVERTPVLGMDGQRSARIVFRGVEVSAGALLGEPSDSLDALTWAVDRAAAAACAEGQGLLDQMFRRTVEYLKQREQFGVKIGSFQALQHRAADMFAENELCRGAMLLAAIKAESDDDEERMAEISAAKLQLADGGWFIQENAIQLHGGVGCTDEQDVGLFFKRLRVLQGCFGDAEHHIDRYQRLKRFERNVS
jgi:alkylation response protein AidB-like acyl-CoA dehydrogenase